MNSIELDLNIVGAILFENKKAPEIAHQLSAKVLPPSLIIRSVRA